MSFNPYKPGSAMAQRAAEDMATIAGLRPSHDAGSLSHLADSLAHQLGLRRTAAEVEAQMEAMLGPPPKKPETLKFRRYEPPCPERTVKTMTLAEFAQTAEGKACAKLVAKNESVDLPRIPLPGIRGPKAGARWTDEETGETHEWTGEGWKVLAPPEPPPHPLYAALMRVTPIHPRFAEGTL